jgi:uncharacterized protein YggU (UPF0235/DUF167 family)
MLAPAIRFAAAKANSPATIHLLCYVKPGVSAIREGIAAVTNRHIKMYVAAQARDGEANKAVRQVIANALKVAQSDVEVTRGLKSKKKTVAVSIGASEKTAEEEVERIKNILLGSVCH